MKLPDKIFGKDTKEAYKKCLEKKAEEQEDGNKGQITPIEIKADINRKDYIQIPDTSLIISKREMHYNKNWNDAHLALSNEGLFMPSPAIFMDYFLKVKQAGEGSIILKDAEGSPLSRDESKDLWDYLSSTNRLPFNGKSCWTWLDAKFIKNSAGQLELESQHRILNGTLVGKTFPLETYIEKDCYVDLNFNSQGLAIKESNKQKYEQGKNIYFWYPRENAVAGFYADSGRAGLGCGGFPSDCYASLGVFGCAEGASQNFSSGGKLP